MYSMVTHHSIVVSLHVLDYLLGLLIPEEHVATVTPTHNKLTVKAIKVDTFHWKL